MRSIALTLLLALGACTTVELGELDDFHIVDCELTGSIMKVGALTTVGVGRVLRTSYRDCEVRRGISHIDASRETSLRLWLPLAQEGDKVAQTHLGTLYEKGLGQAPDYANAARWYQKAADQGHGPALTSLGVLYEKGLGVPQDTRQALELYRRAANLDTRLVLATELDSRDAQIRALRDELDSAKRERDRALEERARLDKRVGDLNRDLTAAQRQNDAARARAVETQIRDSQTRIGQLAAEQTRRDRELERFAAIIQRLETDDATRAPSPTANAPVIELTEPRLTRTRGVDTVALTGTPQTTPVVGRVRAPAGIAAFTLNERVEAVAADGTFRSEIALRGTTTPVRIVAVDKAGRTSTLDFILVINQAAGATPSITANARPQGFGNYHALVIGNANYLKWDRLDTPQNDARAVKETLESQYGFKVTLLVDATRAQIIAALANLRRTLGAADNLLIYYSGHGEIDTATLAGYWVPIDAARDNVANYVSSADITNQLDAMAAKQVLVVSDSCYSGILVRSVAAQLDQPPAAQPKLAWLQLRSTLRSRKAMSSGGVKPVLDAGGGRFSVFTRQFVQALTERREPFEAHEVFGTIASRVAQVARGFGEEQQPQYGPLRLASHVGGDFVFVPR